MQNELNGNWTCKNRIGNAIFRAFISTSLDQWRKEFSYLNAFVVLEVILRLLLLRLPGLHDFLTNQNQLNISRAIKEEIYEIFKEISEWSKSEEI